MFIEVIAECVQIFGKIVDRKVGAKSITQVLGKHADTFIEAGIKRSAEGRQRLLQLQEPAFSNINVILQQ